MSAEDFRIGQRVVYIPLDHHKEYLNELEAEIIWIYNNKTAEIRLLDKRYKVELVELCNLKILQ